MAAKRKQPPGQRLPSERLIEGSGHSDRVACLVADLFIQGHSPAKIADVLEKNYGLKMSREAPYRYLTYCTRRGYLRFVPPANTVLADQLRRRFPALLQVDVADTDTSDGVLERAAEMVLDLIRAKASRGKRSVRIGCAGGGSMAVLVRKLSELLSQPQLPLPEEVVFQNLVAGFDLTDPTSNPIRFLAQVHGLKPSGVNVKCQLLEAPALVHPQQRSELLKLLGIENAAAMALKCDIIVTSCGGIDDEHQMLSKYYPRKGRIMDFLKERRCVGDMLWLPLCEDGPFRFEALTEKEQQLVNYRTMSLIELTQLPELIRGGTDVVMAVGPCPGCLLTQPPTKGPILRAILNQVEALVTHLVTNTEIALYVLGETQRLRTLPAGALNH